MGGLGFVRRGLTLQKLIKSQPIDSVSCFNFSGIKALFGGLSPQKPTCGNGTVTACSVSHVNITASVFKFLFAFFLSEYSRKHDTVSGNPNQRTLLALG